MSLRVWLPLNGDLENKGIDEEIIFNTTGTPTVDNNGKIGKCYSFNGSSYFISQKNNFLENMTECSFACWIKDTYTGNSYMRVFGIGTHKRVHLDITSAGKPRFFVSKNGTNSSYWAPIGTTELRDSQWHHICGTFNNKEAKIYIDGICEATVVTGALPTVTGGQLEIGHIQDGIKMTGYLNDLRIYDHCLSQKEVKEISQGLILHYKLDNDPKTINGIRNYLGNGYPFFDKPQYTDYTRSHLRVYGLYRSDKTVIPSDAGMNLVVDPNGAKCREIVFSATRDNTISYQYELHHSWKYSGHENSENNFDIWNDFQVGDYLTFSFEIWGDNYFEIHAVNLYVKVANSSAENLLFIPSNILFSNSEDLNKWHKISGTVQMTQDFYDCIHSTDLQMFILVINIRSIANVSIANQPITVRIRKLMLEKSDVAHEWTPAPEDLDIDTAKISDSSGYGNDGMIIGEISFLTDSSRYGISAYMNNTGTANHIEYEALNTSGAYSIAFWTKASLSKNQVIFADNVHGYEFGILNNLFYTSTTSNKGWSTSKFITNNWNHIAIVSQDGIEESSVKLFVNGVEETSRAGANNWYSHNKTNPWLLNRGNNNTYAADASLSDFRIYATALSAEDITTLYHTSAQVDDLGSFHAFEFCEKETENLSDFEVSTVWTADGVTRTIEETDFGTAFKLIPSSGNKRIYKNVVDVWEENQEYIVSFFAKSTTDGIICNMSRSLVDFSRDFTLTTQWKKYTGIIKSTATVSGGTLSFAIKSTSGTVYITNIKLELANQNLIKVHQNGLWDSNNIDEIDFVENAQLNKNNSNIIGNNFIEK